MPIEKSLLKELRKELPRGGVKQIAKDYNCVPSYVSDVLRGKKENDEIIKLAIDCVNEFKRKTKQLNAKVMKSVKNN